MGADVVVDEHLRGPERGDVFSVTKTVLALALAVAAVLPVLRGTLAATHTWVHLLTMTRAAGRGRVGRRRRDRTARRAGRARPAPRGGAARRRVRLRQRGSHLLRAADGAVLGEPVATCTARELLAPLGIRAPEWAHDLAGVPFGRGHLRLPAADLGRLGRLLLDGGRVAGRPPLDPAFLAAMTTPHTPGGAPEERPYGYRVRLDDGMPLAGGGAGPHLLVVPGADAVVVTTGDAGFDPGPPPTGAMPPGCSPR